jgi:hypothetical protein
VFNSMNDSWSVGSGKKHSKWADLDHRYQHMSRRGFAKLEAVLLIGLVSLCIQVAVWCFTNQSLPYQPAAFSASRNTGIRFLWKAGDGQSAWVFRSDYRLEKLGLIPTSPEKANDPTVSYRLWGPAAIGFAAHADEVWFVDQSGEVQIISQNDLISTTVEPVPAVDVAALHAKAPAGLRLTGSAIVSIAPLRDSSQAIVVNDSGQAGLWTRQPDNSLRASFLPEVSSATRCWLNATETAAYFALSDCSLVRYELQTGKLSQCLPPESVAITAVAWDEEQDRIYIARASGEVIAACGTTGKTFWRRRVSDLPVLALAASGKRNELLVSLVGEELARLELTTGDEQVRVVGLPMSVRQFAYASGEDRAMCATNCGQIVPSPY